MRLDSAATVDALTDDRVVLCTSDGRIAGSASRASVHHAETPLHLAFSCYVFARDGRFLVTRRAVGKLTWPGVVTNSCCGHPRPTEQLDLAVERRLVDELGVRHSRLRLVLPAFSYRAAMPDGVVENELCPVYMAEVGSPRLDVNRDEVEDAWWMRWDAFVSLARAGDVSPWCAAQVRLLETLGPSPDAWPSASIHHLPQAARGA